MANPAEQTPRIPVRHLSVRVPWHDACWDGTVCRLPRKNASCLALNRIGATKDEELNEKHAGAPLDKVPSKEAPPCFAERVNFLSPRAQQRVAHHAYSDTSEHHKHIVDTPFRRKPAAQMSEIPRFHAHTGDRTGFAGIGTARVAPGRRIRRSG